MTEKPTPITSIEMPEMTEDQREYLARVRDWSLVRPQYNLRDPSDNPNLEPLRTKLYAERQAEIAFREADYKGAPPKLCLLDAIEAYNAALWRPIGNDWYALNDTTTVLIAFVDGRVETHVVDRHTDPVPWAKRGAFGWCPCPMPPKPLVPTHV